MSSSYMFVCQLSVVLTLICLTQFLVQPVKRSRYTGNYIQSLGGWPRSAGTQFWWRSTCMSDNWDSCFLSPQNIFLSNKFHLHFCLFLFQDIQIRGVNRDEKNIQMAQSYPNSTHFLTYRHSLRVSLYK
jgi:hypothetical protein